MRARAPRRSAAVLALIAAAPLASAAAPERAATASATTPRRTKNVILLTLDGLRIQELFGGMDPLLAARSVVLARQLPHRLDRLRPAGDEEQPVQVPRRQRGDLGGELERVQKKAWIYDLDRARQRFWRDTPGERRAVLLPYFWGTLAPQGIVLGDKDRGCSVQPSNPLLFSAPGYAEILTGQPQPDVITNDTKRYPHRTVLEFVRSELRLGKRQVATIGSWDGFGTLSSSEADAFFTNTGYERVPAGMATPRMEFLGDLQFQIMALWEEGRSDAVTFNIALEYLRTERPRLLYIALGESDDWAHARRYDRLLDYINVADGYLRRLWQTLQSIDRYRGSTTLILTNDHGLGQRLSDPGRGVAKTYHVLVDGVPDAAALQALREGVPLEKGVSSRPARVHVKGVTRGGTWLEVVLTEGKNRQVRRMCAAVGHDVLELARVAIGAFALSGLPAGEWRRLEGDEVASLVAPPGERAAPARRSAWPVRPRRP